MNWDLKSWTEQEVVLGNTTFYINKLLAEEQFWLFEDLRPGLATLISSLEGFEQNDNVLTMIGQLVGNLPRTTIKTAMNELMPHVKYKHPGMQNALPVGRDRGSAFRDLKVHEIYELLFRAFLVNFHGSLDAVLGILAERAKEISNEQEG